MDINEKDNIINNETPEEVEESTAENTSEEMISEENVSEDNISEEDSYSTLGVTQEDIDSEMTRYGALPEEGEAVSEDVPEAAEDATPKKKSLVQKPIIIAAVAFLLTAVAVLATIFIYKGFFKPGISGAWLLSEAQESGVYFVFDKEGNVAMDGGGIKYFGTYTMEKADGYDVINSDFYYLAAYGGQAVVTYSDNKQTMTLTFANGSLEFVKADLPKIDIDPSDITHASADELGIDTFTVDKSILGSWSEAMYGTYTFNKDGTGSYRTEYTYNEYAGYGLGQELNFKYTVYEDQILFTIDYYNGSKEDAAIDYYLDGSNLVLNGMGYSAVK